MDGFGPQQSNPPSPGAPKRKALIKLKPRAYRARGFKTSTPQKVQESLAQILSHITMDNNIKIRTVASSVGIEDEYTAVFVFGDNIPRPECERSYPLLVSPQINTTTTEPNCGDTNPTFITIDSHFKGLTILHDSTAEKTIDLIILPGLGRGHAWGPFKDPQDEYVWLVGSLPKHVPVFRIVTYGYDTIVPGSSSSQDFEALASQLRCSLRNIRAKPTIPIVFLAHSLGGLVIKQAMVDMKASNNEKDNHNFLATYGMYFFGVPNEGMSIGPLKCMIRGQPNEEFIMSLNNNSHLLRNLVRAFNHAFDFADSQIISFYETRGSPSSFFDPETKQYSMTSEKKVFMVNQTSATHGRPNECKAHHIQALDLDHPSLVRYTRDDHNYLMIQTYLKGCVKNAQKVVEQRQGMLEASQSDTSNQSEKNEIISALNEGEGHFKNRRAAQAKVTWRKLSLARKAFRKALQLPYGLDDEDHLLCNVLMRLATIEWEMSNFHSLERSRKEHHLHNAEIYCDEASRVALKPPAIEGVLEKAKLHRDKISRRRVRLNEERRRRVWFGIRWVLKLRTK